MAAGWLSEVETIQERSVTMKLIKIVVAAVFASALLAGSALADDKTCCEKAKAEGKDCAHKCCADAKKDGKTCEKCNPKKDDKKPAEKK